MASKKKTHGPEAAAKGGASAFPDWSDLLKQGSEAAAKFAGPALDSFKQMQAMLGEFAGKGAGALDPKQLAAAWKAQMDKAGQSPFAQFWPTGEAGFDPKSLLGLPSLGFAREHQERWQALAQAQMEYQQAQSAYMDQLQRSSGLAFDRFEKLLKARADEKRPVTSARELFDLWIDAAEEAWSKVALSKDFRTVYGALVNAQMRVRSGIQREVEQFTRQFGMPTRSEVDAGHRKLHALENELRELKMELAAARAAGKRSAPAAAKPAAKPAAKKKSAARAPSRPARR